MAVTVAVGRIRGCGLGEARPTFHGVGEEKLVCAQVHRSWFARRLAGDKVKKLLELFYGIPRQQGVSRDPRLAGGWQDGRTAGRQEAGW